MPAETGFCPEWRLLKQSYVIESGREAYAFLSDHTANSLPPGSVK